MPVNCPRCQIAQDAENKTCINCGEDLQAKTASAPVETDPPLAGRAPWKLAALIFAGVLAALWGAALLVGKRPPAVPAGRLARAPKLETKAVPDPKTAPPAPAVAPADPALDTVPLTVTLASTNKGLHIPVGSGVTFTAFTTLPHGQSATLTLFYRRGQGRKTIFSFAQGSLCSTLWSPPGAGRYQFTALALDERRRAAVSRTVELIADAPPSPKTARTAAREVTVSPLAARVPRPTLAKPRPAARPAASRLPAALPTYHVAAAHFPFFRNAAVLAYALRARGYPAVTRRVPGSHGKAVYVVETGTFLRPEEAHRAVLDLQRSGYPAYSFGLH